MTNLVTIDKNTYLVDVADGSKSPCRPIPLTPDIEMDLVYPARGRLEYKSLAKHTDPKQRVWVFSTQADRETPWTEVYSFVEIEFFPDDFEVMNLATMTMPQSFFVQTVVATKLLLDPHTAEPEGTLILFKDSLKRRVKERTEVIGTFDTEEQRVGALKHYFQIELTPAEQRAIRGLPSALRVGKGQPKGLH